MLNTSHTPHESLELDENKEFIFHLFLYKSLLSLYLHFLFIIENNSQFFINNGPQFFYDHFLLKVTLKN